MTITKQELASRHDRVRSALIEGGFDALIAYSTAKVAANVRYLTDYFVRFAGMQNMREGGYHMFGSCAVLYPDRGRADGAHGSALGHRPSEGDLRVPRHGVLGPVRAGLWPGDPRP